MTRWIGITLGDVTGIGPEVTLKAIALDATSTDARYLLIGDTGYLRRLNQQLGLNLPLQDFISRDVPGRFFVSSPTPPLSEKLSIGAPEAANAAVEWLRDAAGRCLRGELDAMVTAPVNKEAIVRAGHDFIGQTEFLSQIAGADRTAMMLLGHNHEGRWLRVALVTTHLPLKRVPENITAEKVELAVELAVQSCRDLQLPRARIAVCGLNPHAGEGGEFGREEIDTIRPVVESMKQRGFDVVGPMPADTLFHFAYRGDFDVVVAMYHDQGLGPLKLVAFDNGVNWTLGLPFIRTSPDHGTAYDIAGKNKANPSSMLAAIRLAKQLSRHSAKTILT